MTLPEDIMTFSEQLNNYIHELGVTRKDLAEASGLSPASISRYCSGQREPAYDSSQLSRLASGIEALSRQTGRGSFEGKAVRETLASTLNDGIVVDYEVFIANLNSLLRSMDIRISELARGIYSDSSYVSRILSGNRRPGNISQFINDVAAYMAHRYAGSAELETLAQLTGRDSSELRSSALLQDHLVEWLGSNSVFRNDDSIPSFLSRMDDFDLSGYMQSIRFSEIRIPPSLPQLPTRKEYTGIKKMMESELDFMKATVMSKSTDACTLYSDMPLAEMASDPDFPKKYLYGLAMMLKRGLHLNFIHDVSRPFAEMMMGLEMYIPMYMTGQISPYYLPASQSSVFSHLLKVSGAAALEGFAITGNQAGGRYVLYRSREDVAHYRQRAQDLLAKAMPLMDIFREERMSEYSIVRDRVLKGDDVKFICSNLPVYFLRPETAEAAFEALNLLRPMKAQLKQYYAQMRKKLLKSLETGRVVLTIPDLSRELFEQSPVNLSFVDLFSGFRDNVSYETYREHIEELKAFAGEQPNLTLELNPSPSYRNINITIAGDRMVIVSKEKSPSIHFVIYHKRMIRAFQNFIPPAV